MASLARIEDNTSTCCTTLETGLRTPWQYGVSPSMIVVRSDRVNNCLFEANGIARSPYEDSHLSRFCRKHPCRCVVRWQEQSLDNEAEASRSIEAVRHMLENFELVRLRLGAESDESSSFGLDSLVFLRLVERAKSMACSSLRFEIPNPNFVFREARR